MQQQHSTPEPRTFHRTEFRIRDPFILPVAAEKKYYMFGTTALRGESMTGGPHFDCYEGTDLVHWHGPHRIFDGPPDYWGTEDYWAAEAHRYRGRYYLFASFKAPGKCRGTDILISTTDSPLGPYVPHTENSPITPHDWECLDGTLFVDEADQPWMVFCHEWVQVSDGTICAVPLSPDLRRPIGVPTLLLAASESGWSEPHNGKDRITDGPFLHRTRTGKLLMMWSSVLKGKYAMGVATSESGKLQGPWQHTHPVLVGDDGGHGMLFRDFSGNLLLSVHRPNRGPAERPILFAIDDSGDELKLGQAV
jgi:arabinan endo-1,5-alpha-L-arabinosidase